MSLNLVHGKVYSIQHLCDNVCQCLWFSPGVLVFSTNKTNSHDITEILLKVALNTIMITLAPTIQSFFVYFYLYWNLIIPPSLSTSFSSAEESQCKPLPLPPLKKVSSLIISFINLMMTKTTPSPPHHFPQQKKVNFKPLPPLKKSLATIPFLISFINSMTAKTTPFPTSSFSSAEESHAIYAPRIPQKVSSHYAF